MAAFSTYKIDHLINGNGITCFSYLSVFFLRILVSYLVITLIALQSMFAVAYSPALHQEKQVESHVDEHFENHEAKHHSAAELALLALTEVNVNFDDSHEHPSCEQNSHQNHCHHTSLVYIDLQQIVSLPAQVKNQIPPYHVVFSSRISSPDFRPPIA